MTWFRRIGIVMRTYWLAYVLVGGVSVLFASWGDWPYVVAWGVTLVAVTAFFVYLLARQSVGWEELRRSAASGPRLSASDEMYAIVQVGPYARYVVKIIRRSSEAGYHLRLRHADVLQRGEVRVDEATAADLTTLIDDGVIALVDDPSVARKLRSGYFRGDRVKAAREVELSALRGSYGDGADGDGLTRS